MVFEDDYVPALPFGNIGNISGQRDCVTLKVNQEIADTAEVNVDVPYFI